MLGNVVLFLVR